MNTSRRFACRTVLRPATLALITLLRPAPMLAGPVQGALAPAYRLRASIALTAPQIDGTVEVAFINTSARTLREAVFFLFPNRFSVPDAGVTDASVTDAGVTDVNRQFIYPEQDFVPASMEVLEARDAEAVVPAEPRRPRRFAGAPRRPAAATLTGSSPSGCSPPRRSTTASTRLS